MSLKSPDSREMAGLEDAFQLTLRFVRYWIDQSRIFRQLGWGHLPSVFVSKNRNDEAVPIRDRESRKIRDLQFTLSDNALPGLLDLNHARLGIANEGCHHISRVDDLVSVQGHRVCGGDRQKEEQNHPCSDRDASHNKRRLVPLRNRRG